MGICLLAFFLLLSAGKGIVLWNTVGGGTPYAQRAWIALLESGVTDFEHRQIDLSQPIRPPELVEKYAKASGVTDGTTKVPLLEHGDKAVIESDEICRYVAEHVSGTDELEYKDERIERFLKAWQPVEASYYDIVKAMDQQEADEAIVRFKKSLEDLDSVLEDCFADPWVCGSTFSLAECLTAPWVQRFFVILQHYRSVDVSELLRPTTSRWMSALRTRPSVMESASPPDSMIEVNSKYYVKFLTPGSPAFQSSANSGLPLYPLGLSGWGGLLQSHRVPPR